MVSLVPSSRIRCARDLFSTNIGGEVVMLDVAAGKYYSLNPTGSAVWSMLGSPDSQGMDLDTLLKNLETRFDAAREAIVADVHALIGELHAKGLVEVF
jgi:hypothetical protein